jgi:hypothetical protein
VTQSSILPVEYWLEYGRSGTSSTVGVAGIWDSSRWQPSSSQVFRKVASDAVVSSLVAAIYDRSAVALSPGIVMRRVDWFEPTMKKLKATSPSVWSDGLIHGRTL